MGNYLTTRGAAQREEATETSDVPSDDTDNSDDVNVPVFDAAMAGRLARQEAVRTEVRAMPRGWSIMPIPLGPLLQDNEVDTDSDSGADADTVTRNTPLLNPEMAERLHNQLAEGASASTSTQPLRTPPQDPRECPICTELYDRTARYPYTCAAEYHALCASCVKKVLASPTIAHVCPSCKKNCGFVPNFAKAREIGVGVVHTTPELGPTPKNTLPKRPRPEVWDEEERVNRRVAPQNPGERFFECNICGSRGNGEYCYQCRTFRPFRLTEIREERTDLEVVVTSRPSTTTDGRYAPQSWPGTSDDWRPPLPVDLPYISPENVRSFISPTTLGHSSLLNPLVVLCETRYQEFSCIPRTNE